MFGAGLVRVPRAWGTGGEAMAEAASLPLPYPETAVVDESALPEQSLALAAQLPERPLVLGGCCCVHVGAVEGLVARHGRVAVVWIDAHGDLNTPETSPSGNVWGMPLRMLVDGGTVRAEDVALVGTRRLDPPEEEFIERSGLHLGADRLSKALAGSEAVYVAIDCDGLEACEVVPFMPEPGGLLLEDAERLLRDTTAAVPGGRGLLGSSARSPKRRARHPARGRARSMTRRA
ncbi:MAG: arginase family protein [Gaiellaceae bacterium]